MTGVRRFIGIRKVGGRWEKVMRSWFVKVMRERAMQMIMNENIIISYDKNCAPVCV